MKACEEPCHRLIAIGLLGVAGAEPAQPVAIGNMDVKRNTLSCRNRGNPAGDSGSINAGMKVRRGRVAGVPRGGIWTHINEPFMNDRLQLSVERGGWR